MKQAVKERLREAMKIYQPLPELQERKLKSKGWTIRYISTVDCAKHTGELGRYDVRSWKSFSEAKDWIESHAEGDRVWARIEISLHNPKQFACLHEDLRIEVERREIEGGITTRVLGPADCNDGMPSGLALGMIEAMVWNRLAHCSVREAGK